MELKLGGYFPKRVAARPEWLDAAGVRDVFSMSVCVSPGPDEWNPQGLQNALGLYDSPELARQVVAGGGWRLFAFRFSTSRFCEGRQETWAWPSVAPVALPTNFRFVGFDVVNTSMADGFQMECSPLSCNSAAERWPTNSHCLFTRLEEAVAAAARFSTDGAEPVEPGDYYVIEVLCEESGGAAQQGDEADKR